MSLDMEFVIIMIVMAVNMLAIIGFVLLGIIPELREMKKEGITIKEFIKEIFEELFEEA